MKRKAISKYTRRDFLKFTGAGLVGLTTDGQLPLVIPAGARGLQAGSSDSRVLLHTFDPASTPSQPSAGNPCSFTTVLRPPRENSQSRT